MSIPVGLGKARRLPVALACVAVLLQVAWPLVPAGSRSGITTLVVLAVVSAMASHAWLERGAAWALTWLGMSVAFGFLVELVGTRTGFPFGHYAYTDQLAPSVAGVPLVIPLAWAMMSYPALLAGRALGRSRPARLAIATWALASWDLFLDPQMVGEDYWRWDSAGPTLPGIPGIPLANYAGWLVASALLMAALMGALARVTERAPGSDLVPVGLYLWTWAGGIIANVFFLGRPAVGIIGGIAMGLVAVPLAMRLSRR